MFAPRRTRTASRAGHGQSWVPYACLSPTVLLMVVLMLVPIAMVVGYSLRDNVIVQQNSHWAGLTHYRQILADSAYLAAIRNTAFFTVVSVLAHMVLGLAFAMLLNTPLLGMVTKSFFRVIYVLPWLFTVAIIAVLWRLLLNPNGVINYLLMEFGLTDRKIEWFGSRKTALYALTAVNIWAGYPFFMVSLLAGLQGIPKDLYEAATVDGANARQRFFSITLTQLRPILISLGLLDFIWTTQQFALIWMITGGGPLNATEMFSTYTYKLAFGRYEFSAASASAVIFLLLSMVLAYLYARNQKARN